MIDACDYHKRRQVVLPVLEAFQIDLEESDALHV